MLGDGLWQDICEFNPPIAQPSIIHLIELENYYYVHKWIIDPRGRSYLDIS